MDLQNLKDLINKLTEFGTNPKVESENKILELKRLLVEIYAHYLNSNSHQFDNFTENIEAPNFDYNEIRKNVESNFPELGWYHSILNSHKIFEEVKLEEQEMLLMI